MVVLIESKWNVNYRLFKNNLANSLVLIESKWNVNQQSTKGTTTI